MLLALLWLYYITFWPVSKTFFSTPLEVVARFFFAAFGGGERGERARTPRAPPRGGCHLQPCFHTRVTRQTIGSGELQRIFLLATPLSYQGESAAGREEKMRGHLALLQGAAAPCNPAFRQGENGSVTRASHGYADGSRHALYRSHARHGGRGEIGGTIGTEYPAQLE